MLAFHTRRRSLATVILAVALLCLMAAAPVAAKNPPGNNGTVKIDGFAWDSHPNNEPHVGCGFEVDFYGFDHGDFWADVTFEAHPPTGRGILLTDRVFIGADAAGGGTDLDAEVRYDLSDALAGYTAHAVQGYHVKLTIMAEGFLKGAGPKHKVFWVGPCEGATVVPPPTQPPNPPRGGPPTRLPGGGQQPREETRGGTTPGDGEAVLPDTSMSAEGSLLTVLATVLAGLAALSTARARRPSSRR